MENARSVAKEVDNIILSLPNDKAVQDTIMGPNGLATSSETRTDHLFVADLSTISLDMSLSLHDYCELYDLKYIDTPISGGIWGAEHGNLTIMAGCSDEDFISIEPLLSKLAINIVHMGPAGSGIKAKLLHNMIGEIQVQAFAEAIAIAPKIGLDIAALYRALETGMASSQVLTRLYDSYIKHRGEVVNVTLDTAYKDQIFLQRMAQSYGVRLESSERVLFVLEHLMKQGYAKSDVTATIKYFEEKHLGQ